MKTNKQNDSQSPGVIKKRRRLIITIAVVVIAVGVLWLGLSLFFHNYAQDAAQPIEAALIKAGAVKECSSGDPGKGPDNLQPNYGAKYIINKNKDDTIKLVNQAASDNGYSLTHQDSSYDYIEWYSDNKGKPSTYPGLEPGNVTIGMDVYSGGDKLGCVSTGTFKLDADHTGITLGVTLPVSKH